MSCNPTYNLIGLCMRAGKCVFGMEAVCEDIRRGRTQSVLISSSLAGNAREKLERLCQPKRIPLHEIEDRDGALGRCIGREGVKILSIQDRRLAYKIYESIETI